MEDHGREQQSSFGKSQGSANTREPCTPTGISCTQTGAVLLWLWLEILREAMLLNRKKRIRRITLR